MSYTVNTTLVDDADRIWFTSTRGKNHIYRAFPPEDAVSWMVRSDGRPYSYCGRDLYGGRYFQSPHRNGVDTRDELQDCAVCLRAWHADEDS